MTIEPVTFGTLSPTAALALDDGATGETIGPADDASMSASDPAASSGDGAAAMEFPPWIQENTELRDKMVRGFSLARDHFTADQLAVARKYDLLGIYRHLYHGRGADELVPRLHYDTAQIMVYQGIAMRCAARSVLSIGAGRWYENLGMRLALAGLSRAIGFDFVSWKVNDARVNLEEFRRALGDDPEGSIHQVHEGDGRRMMQPGFVEGLADDESSLETFDLVTWVHPYTKQWVMGEDEDQTTNRTDLTRMHELLRGAAGRISENGSMLIVFDENTWNPERYAALFQMMRCAGFDQRFGLPTLYGEVGFKNPLGDWLEFDMPFGMSALGNRDIIFSGGKEALETFERMLTNLRKIGKRLEFSDEATLFFLVSKCAQGERNLLLEALALEGANAQEGLSELIWRNSTRAGGSAEFVGPLAAFLENRHGPNPDRS